MKKHFSMIATTAIAAAAIVAPALTSCSDKNKKSEDSAQAEQAVVDMVKSVREAENDSVYAGAMPYDAAFFTNPENRADTTTPGANTYVETPSGLRYAIISQGNGPKPAASDEVTVNYAGCLTDMDATEFDSSYRRGEPTSFPLNGVIRGWTEGLQLMNVGSVYEFYIPADLAYGERGGGPIPPNAPLLFKVELISINTPAK